MPDGGGVMAKAYSMLARRYINVPDHKPPALVEEKPEPARAKSSMLAVKQLVQDVEECENQITELKAECAKLSAKCEAECEAKDCAIEAADKCRNSELAMGRKLNDAVAAAAQAKGELKGEVALRLAAEKRVADIQAELNALKAKPAPVVQKVEQVNTDKIVAAVRAAIPPAVKQAPQPTEITATVVERDANGDARTWEIKKARQE